MSKLVNNSNSPFWSRLLVFSFAFLFLFSCGLPKKENNSGAAVPAASESNPSATGAPSPSPSASANPFPTVSKPAGTAVSAPCVMPSGLPDAVAKNPSKIADIVAILNALPKPVSFSCLIDVLPRPLKLSATSSTLSVQPAWLEKNPRLFLMVGNTLLGIVPDGSGSSAIEASELLSDTVSVKAEILLPVTENITANAPFARLLKPDKSGTTCSACHFSESAAGGSFPESAFKSKAIRHMTNQNVDIYNVWELARDCGNTSGDRCNTLRSLFSDDKTERYVFPQAMPTMF